MVESWEKYILWLLWWVGLGVLSSVGLGTGLHTFLIYLGPHIAQVSTNYFLLDVFEDNKLIFHFFNVTRAHFHTYLLGYPRSI